MINIHVSYLWGKRVIIIITVFLDKKGTFSNKRQGMRQNKTKANFAVWVVKGVSTTRGIFCLVEVLSHVIL